MSHEHNIIDTDAHFRIDPVTRAILNKSDKTSVVQNDLDSERFTFQAPRYIEEHDMTLCDRVEVHFTNITRTKREQSSDVYIVKKEDITSDQDTIFFGWLVSRNATKLVGKLNFSVSFICTDDNGVVIYEWSTYTFESIQVLARLNNTETVVESYPDLYSQLKQDVLDSIPESDGEVIDRETVTQIVDEYLEENPPVPHITINGEEPDENGNFTIEVQPSENANVVEF